MKNVLIGEQYEISENYQKFLKIVKEKDIHVMQVEAGQELHIEKDFYIDVLWPNSNKIIRENMLNNNSLVLKMEYKNFSMLFTADIEKIAEKEILNLYKDYPEKLQATILKVAHHGSKTSTTEEFLKTVNPQYAFIGIGENNLFGHPNEEIIRRLNNRNIKIYRTDKMGEIEIFVKNTLKIKPYLYKINNRCTQ